MASEDENSSESPRREASDAAEQAQSALSAAQSAAEEAQACVDRAQQAVQSAVGADNIAGDAAREAYWEATHSSDPEVQRHADAVAEAAQRAHEDAAHARARSREALAQSERAQEAEQAGDTEAAAAAAQAAKTAASDAMASADAAKAAAQRAVQAEQEADRARIAVQQAGDAEEYVDENAVRERLSAGAPALYLAEFDDPESVVHAAEKVRDAGYENWDVHTPYPVHGLDEAMGLRPTKLGIVSFVAAMVGLVSAVVMIQYMNNWDYPIIVGGKPPGAFPSMVPIMFELTILLTGFGTLFGMLHLNRLPRHHHPIFASDRFAAASDDKFFVSIEAEDPKFDLERTRELLDSLAPSHVELVREEAS